LQARARFPLTLALRRALLTPGSLALLVAATVMAFSPSLWPVALGAGVAELLLLLYYRCNRRFLRRIRDEQTRREWHRQGQRVKRLQATLDPGTAGILHRIVSLQQQAGSQIASSRDDGVSHPEALEQALSPTGGLLEGCLRLAAMRQRLAAYLEQVQPAERQRQAMEIEARLDACHDAVARSCYLQALQHKRSELENYCAIQQAVARVDGQLENIECRLGNLVGKLVRLGLLDGAHAAEACDRLSALIAELNQSTAALELSLNETLSF
jgi:hypothetical protein